MNELPERVYIGEYPVGSSIKRLEAGYQPNKGDVEYIRADLVPQWQPIESAPHDKKIMLTCEIENGRRYVCCGRYIEKFTEENTESDLDFYEYDEATDCYYTPEGWYEIINNWDDYSSVKINDHVVAWANAIEPLPKGPT